ncbi:HD-GYP domain-containing protein [Deinococcus oregonensis]|uniref:HD-GYP domain-containing protein n=1 Tax=Deinococcus oregonensis TaxID=1805970 RepID=A0ABV6AVQ4_9DEIO
MGSKNQGHTQRVAQLAQQAGLNSQDTKALYLGALLHDLGKAGILDHVLLKAGAPSDEEWVWVGTNPRLGHDLALRIPNLPAGTLDVVLYHHERWDGLSSGVSGARIPTLAQLCCVIDALDAVTNFFHCPQGCLHTQGRVSIKVCKVTVWPNLPKRVSYLQA